MKTKSNSFIGRGCISDIIATEKTAMENAVSCDQVTNTLSYGTVYDRADQTSEPHQWVMKGKEKWLLTAAQVQE
jgi:hypothetical protein